MIDCDSVVADSFNNEDRQHLEKLAELLAASCDW